MFRLGLPFTITLSIFGSPAGATELEPPAETPICTSVCPSAPTRRDAAFGTATASAGLVLVIGSPGAGRVGKVYVEEEGRARTTLHAPTGITNANAFGHAVAISPDTDTIVVGAPGEVRGSGSGRVFVYSRAPGATFPASPTQELLPSGARATAAAFGHSMAFAGDHLFVGAPNTLVEVQLQGVVIGYVRSGATMAQSDALSAVAPALEDGQPTSGRFGSSLAASEGYLAVGAPNSLGDEGRVYLYRHLGTALFFDSTLAPDSSKRSKGGLGNKFGAAVALTRNAFGYPIVLSASPGEDSVATDAGATAVFEIPGGSRSPRVVANLLPTPAARLAGSSIGFKGSTLFVGAPMSDGAPSGRVRQGAVLAYDLAELRRAGTRPVRTIVREQVGAVGQDDDRFGESVVISERSATLHVGTPAADYSETETGSGVVGELEVASSADGFEAGEWYETTQRVFPLRLADPVSCAHRGGTECMTPEGDILTPNGTGTTAHARFAVPANTEFVRGVLTEYSGGSCNTGATFSEVLIRASPSDPWQPLGGWEQTVTVTIPFTFVVSGASEIEFRSRDLNGSAFCDDVVWRDVNFED